MKVVHLIKATRISGAERHLLILLTELRRRNLDVHLLILVEDDNLMDNLVAEARAADIPTDRIIINNHIDLVVTWRIRKRLRRLKPDILHTHLIHADIYGYSAGRAEGVKKIVSSRHNDDSFRHNPLMKVSQRALWRGFDAGIAISDAIRRFIVDVEGAPAEKIHLIRYGMVYESPTAEAIESARASLRDELGLAADTPVLGMACRLIEQKGVPYALQAFAKLENDDVHLVIAGDGELRDALEKEALELGIAARVHFLGWREDVPQIMTALDIFLMPSLWEGFGLVLIEAMSKRVPVIATAVSAIPEVVVDGETGILIPPRDADALATAIQKLLDDRTLRLHMGMVAEDRVAKEFSVKRMADQTMRVYRSLLPGTRTDYKQKVSLD